MSKKEHNQTHTADAWRWLQIAEPGAAALALVEACSSQGEPRALGRLDASSQALIRLRPGLKLRARDESGAPVALSLHQPVFSDVIITVMQSLSALLVRPRWARIWLAAQGRGAWLLPTRRARPRPKADPRDEAAALAGAEAGLVSWDPVDHAGAEVCWPADTALLAQYSDFPHAAFSTPAGGGKTGRRVHLPVTLSHTPAPALSRTRPCPRADLSLSLIIPTRDRPELLQPCLDSIRAGLRPQDQLILVDHRTQDPAALRLIDAARAQGAHIVRETGAFNFSRLINAGARQARGDGLVLINNDVRALSDDFASVLAGWLTEPEVGVVGADLRYPDGRRQHVGLALNALGRPGHVDLGARGDGPLGLYRVPREAYAVTGALLAVRRDVFDAAGGLDEALAQDFNDIALCLAARAQGRRVVWTPDVRAIHAESATRGRDGPGRDETAWRHVLERHGALARFDPFFPERCDRTRLRWRMRRAV